NKLVPYKERILPQPTIEGTPEMVKRITPEHVTYRYITDIEVPAEKGEDILKRTYNTQFFPNGEGETTAKIYAGPSFYKDGDKWYGFKTTTITKEAFEAQTDEILGPSSLMGMFITEAFAGSGDPITVDTADTWMSIAGGGVGQQATWDLYHDAAAADTMDDEDTGLWCYVAFEQVVPNVYSCGIYRSWLPIDTSGLPSGACVTDATLSVYVWWKFGTKHYNVIQTNANDPENLVVGDWDEINWTLGSDTVELGGTGYKYY
ncbi:unnamed protein product, partial [marine sediment metagenome]